MDLTNESFTISSKESLLENQQTSPPKHTRKNYPKTISISFLILLILIATIIIFSCIFKKEKPEKFNVYLSSSSRYYCHLTTYPELCYDSISSIVNATILKSTPGPIFSASIKVSINELNNTTIFITKALYTSNTNDSLVGLRLYKCRTWANDALSRLNESLSILGVDSDIDSLTDEEMDNMKALMMAAMRDAIKCSLPLDEIDVMVVESEEKIMGVEEVKLGVEKARKCMVNSIELLDRSETILSDFYIPFIVNDDYNGHSYYDFDYRFLVCLYCGLYLLLAFLYFLLWRGD